MASLLSFFWCCRRRSRKKDLEQPRETDPLIPPSDEIPHAPETHLPAVDHQRMQERMQTIVKAKQGRMVDVDSRTPFRVHRGLGSNSPSHSRSHTGPQDSFSHGLHDEANGGTGPSVPPSRSHSTASMDYGGLDSSLASLAQLPDATSDGSRVRAPALDVRIVSRASSARRGRSQSRPRVGRFGPRGEHVPSGLQLSSPSEAVDTGASVGITVEHAEDVPDDDSIAGDILPTPTAQRVDGLPSELSQSKITQEVRKKFTIDSPVIVSRSWGD